MTYVDGFVLPVPVDRLDEYRRMAAQAGEVWMEHGALEYIECVGDDLDVKDMIPFPRQLQVKPGETVVFSWIVYRSREHRDLVNAKVMKDPRITSVDPNSMPVECSRILYGGFKTIVQLGGQEKGGA